jgi:hypothetical protein
MQERTAGGFGLRVAGFKILGLGLTMYPRSFFKRDGSRRVARGGQKRRQPDVRPC